MLGIIHARRNSPVTSWNKESLHLTNIKEERCFVKKHFFLFNQTSVHRIFTESDE